MTCVVHILSKGNCRGKILVSNARIDEYVKQLCFGYPIDSHSCREVEERSLERTCVLPIRKSNAEEAREGG
jgi:hypothetical protein